MKSQSPASSLPITLNIAPALVFSLVIALLMAVASVAGLLYQSSIYPTVELRRTFVSNDVVNLFIGLPMLLGSMWLAWRGKLIGLLFWPGALFYVLYNYVVYTLAVPFNGAFLVYPALVAGSVYTMIGLVAGFDGKEIRQRLSGAVPERFAGGVLVGFGGFFFLRGIGVIVDALTRHSTVANTELALNVADLLVTPAWVLGGIMLWRYQTFGYMAGLGLLFQASMLFIGLIIFMLLQPLLTGGPFVLTDLITIVVMGLICFIPLALFVRGVLSKG